MGGGVFNAQRRRLADLALRARLPTISSDSVERLAPIEVLVGRIAAFPASAKRWRRVF
jgi:hypothetical protein